MCIRDSSIDEQIDKLKMYCEAMDWKVSEIYTDAGFSGSKLTRPAMEKMITDIGLKKFDTVIVYKLDRLSRSVSCLLYTSLVHQVQISANYQYLAF